MALTAAERGSVQEGEAEWEQDLVRRIMGYVAHSDSGEEIRRRHDRTGARILYGQHWAKRMPNDRAAITANVALALTLQKLALMTRQDPVPVVMPKSASDTEAADCMRLVLIDNWRNDGMTKKLRRLIMLAIATRTAALKVGWDPVANGGHGAIYTDVVPGWNLIIDNRSGDPNLMEYGGHRIFVSRQRSMLMYPGAAKKIKAAENASGNYSRQGPLPKGAPVPTPWARRSMPAPGATIVNGKPVVTSFAGEIGDATPYAKDVEIIEMYHRDHTLATKFVPRRDHAGRIVQEPLRDEAGNLHIEFATDEYTTTETGEVVGIPNPYFVMQDVMEEKLARVYPHWRRTTILLPDEILLEDIPWDGPFPFAYYTDLDPLDGLIGRGSLLQTEQLQGLINVGMSTTTDNLRMGSLNAWFAGAASGLNENTQIIPNVGQVVPVGDVSQIKNITSPSLDANFFTLMSTTQSFMERIIGTWGIMMGQQQGRTDSTGATGMLAETGGARIDMDLDNVCETLRQWARIVSWFAQQGYDEAHAVAVEDETGQVGFQNASAPYLIGEFNFQVEIQSDHAWSATARQRRDLEELKEGLIDKVEYYQRQGTPNWRNMLKRMIAFGGPAAAMGPAASPPPRMRATPPGGSSHRSRGRQPYAQ